MNSLFPRNCWKKLGQLVVVKFEPRLVSKTRGSGEGLSASGSVVTVDVGGKSSVSEAGGEVEEGKDGVVVRLDSSVVVETAEEDGVGSSVLLT